MQPTYRGRPDDDAATPPRSTFSRPLEACQFARKAADAFRVGYLVCEVLAGRLLHLWTFRPAARRA